MKKKRKRKFPSKLAIDNLSKHLRPLMNSDSFQDWLQAWKMFRDKIPPIITTFEQFNMRFKTEGICLEDFLYELKMILHNEGVNQSEFTSPRAELARWVYVTFTEETELNLGNFRRFEAEAVWDLGRKEEADRLFQELIGTHPTFPWGYLGWADCYWMSDWSYHNQPDYEKAEALYREALKQAGEDQGLIRELLDYMLVEKANPQRREEFWQKRLAVKQQQEARKEMMQVELQPERS